LMTVWDSDMNFHTKKKNEHFRIKEEDTEFDFPADMKAWWIVADYDS